MFIITTIIASDGRDLERKGFRAAGRDGVVSVRSHSMQSLQRILVDNSSEKKVISIRVSSTVMKQLVILLITLFLHNRVMRVHERSLHRSQRL